MIMDRGRITDGNKLENRNKQPLWTLVSVKELLSDLVLLVLSLPAAHYIFSISVLVRFIIEFDSVLVFLTWCAAISVHCSAVGELCQAAVNTWGVWGFARSMWLLTE